MYKVTIVGNPSDNALETCYKYIRDKYVHEVLNTKKETTDKNEQSKKQVPLPNN